MTCVMEDVWLHVRRCILPLRMNTVFPGWPPFRLELSTSIMADMDKDMSATCELSYVALDCLTFPLFVPNSGTCLYSEWSITLVTLILVVEDRTFLYHTPVQCWTTRLWLWFCRPLIWEIHYRLAARFMLYDIPDVPYDHS